MIVAGIDLGPSLENESTGLQIARRSDDGVWTVGRTRDHWIRGRDGVDPNALLENAVRDCSIVVIDAPLKLRSEKPWERTLIESADLAASMKPSFTWAILSHAWRAHAFTRELPGEITACEIFPASWFWLCEFDDTVQWKADDTARVRKVAWFRSQCAKLSNIALTINYNDQWALADDADALPCVLCAILMAERRTLQRLDATDPPILFPPKELWDMERLPESIVALNWAEYHG